MVQGARMRRGVSMARAALAAARKRRLSVGTGTQIEGEFEVRGTGQFVIGENCRIGTGLRPGRLVLAGPGRIVIGPGCRIDRAEIHTLEPDAVVTIGEGTYLNDPEIAAVHSVTIGARCEIGSALVYDTDFHSVQRAPRGEVRSAPIVIEDDVWVAARTAVLRGVTIGARSVIGLGAVVTSSVPPDTIVRPAATRADSLGP